MEHRAQKQLMGLCRGKRIVAECLVFLTCMQPHMCTCAHAQCHRKLETEPYTTAQTPGPQICLRVARYGVLASCPLLQESRQLKEEADPISLVRLGIQAWLRALESIEKSQENEWSPAETVGKLPCLLQRDQLRDADLDVPIG